MYRRERPIKYNGYTIKWAGWRLPEQTVWIVGVWLAKPEIGDHYLFATTGGAYGEITYGGLIDLTVHQDGVKLDVFSLPIDKFRAKEVALYLIKGFIDGRRNPNVLKGSP